MLVVERQESINRELAIMILQRALRGRLDQVLMLNGKKMSIELIKELRSTHALLKTEQDVIAAMRDNTLLTQQAKKSFEDKVISIININYFKILYSNVQPNGRHINIFLPKNV